MNAVAERKLELRAGIGQPDQGRLESIHAKMRLKAAANTRRTQCPTDQHTMCVQFEDATAEVLASSTSWLPKHRKVAGDSPSLSSAIRTSRKFPLVGRA